VTFLQAIVIGLVQGVSELFPVSSLGHTVLVPALIGGSWQRLVTQEASPESPYLAFVVGLHVATAIALIWYFRRDWVKLIASFFGSIGRRRVESPDERMAWFIVVATIPVGLLGITLEHPLRVVFAKPLAAACFLTVNGLILLAGERWRRSDARMRARARRAAGAGPGAQRSPARAARSVATVDEESTDPSTLRFTDAVAVGIAQSAALLAGISRDGVCMVAGLFRGLTNEDAVRFAFLLSAPPILAAGLLKIPDLMGHLGKGIHGQILAGSVAAFITAYLSIRFLVRYFRTRTLVPFGAYCLLFGVSAILFFGIA
jgi:undecaprenyl-diphosphatase